MESFAAQLFVTFNVCEGILWIGIAFGFAASLYQHRENAGLKMAAGFLFLAFGVSDFVEIQTGGWYKPWWLLAWKAGALSGLFGVYILFKRRGVKFEIGLRRGEVDQESG